MVRALAASTDGRVLLHGMLDLLSRAGGTPLGGQIDGLGLVRSAAAALQRRRPGLPFPPDLLDPRGMDEVLRQALEDAPAPLPEPEERFDAPAPVEPDPAALVPLARWIERRQAEFRAVDPAAADVARLRLEGCDAAETAVRLDLGTILVRRIGTDLARLASGEGGRP